MPLPWSAGVVDKRIGAGGEAAAIEQVERAAIDGEAVGGRYVQQIADAGAATTSKSRIEPLASVSELTSSDSMLAPGAI